MSCSWDPLTLTFSDARLEAHYTRYQLLNTFLYLDAWFAEFTIGLNLVVWWVIYSRWETHPEFFLFTSFVHAGLAVLVKLALRSQPYRQWLIRNRTKVILAVRTHHVTICVIWYSVMPVTVSSLGQILRIIAFGGSCVFWSYCMPLKFKFHVMHHSVLSMLAFLFVSNHFCGHHLDLWCDMYHIANLCRETSFRPEEQCHRDLVFSLFVLGFALPTAMLWHYEFMSRMKYLEEMGIPLDGSITKLYMYKLLAIAAVSVWALIVFCL